MRIAVNLLQPRKGLVLESVELLLERESGGVLSQLALSLPFSKRPVPDEAGRTTGPAEISPPGPAWQPVRSGGQVEQSSLQSSFNQVLGPQKDVSVPAAKLNQTAEAHDRNGFSTPHCVGLFTFDH